MRWCWEIGERVADIVYESMCLYVWSSMMADGLLCNTWNVDLVSLWHCLMVFKQLNNHPVYCMSLKWGGSRGSIDNWLFQPWAEVVQRSELLMSAVQQLVMVWQELTLTQPPMLSTVANTNNFIVTSSINHQTAFTNIGGHWRYYPKAVLNSSHRAVLSKYMTSHVVQYTCHTSAVALQLHQQQFFLIAMFV